MYMMWIKLIKTCGCAPRTNVVEYWTKHKRMLKEQHVHAYCKPI